MKDLAIKYLKQRLQDSECLTKSYKEDLEEVKEGTERFYRTLKYIKQYEDERDIVNYLLEIVK